MAKANHMPSSQYVAFLRAINVGGRVVKMTALKRIFERAGFDDVTTFIASGNVIFRSSSRDGEKLEKTIERALQSALGYQVVTFLRTPAEIAAIAARDPFGKPILPTSRLFVGLLREPPSTLARRKVAALSTENDEFYVHNRELYWHCAVVSLRSMNWTAMLEKTLGVPATLRNVTTIRRLAAKYPVDVQSSK